MPGPTPPPIPVDYPHTSDRWYIESQLAEHNFSNVDPYLNWVQDVHSNDIFRPYWAEHGNEVASASLFCLACATQESIDVNACANYTTTNVEELYEAVDIFPPGMIPIEPYHFTEMENFEVTMPGPANHVDDQNTKHEKDYACIFQLAQSPSTVQDIRTEAFLVRGNPRASNERHLYNTTWYEGTSTRQLAKAQFAFPPRNTRHVYPEFTIRTHIQSSMADMGTNYYPEPSALSPNATHIIEVNDIFEPRWNSSGMGTVNHTHLFCLACLKDRCDSFSPDSDFQILHTNDYGPFGLGGTNASSEVPGLDDSLYKSLGRSAPLVFTCAFELVFEDLPQGSYSQLFRAVQKEVRRENQYVFNSTYPMGVPLRKKRSSEDEEGDGNDDDMLYNTGNKLGIATSVVAMGVLLAYLI
jgi:hypothetical protein